MTRCGDAGDGIALGRRLRARRAGRCRWLAPNDYVIGVLARICLYATLALGLNVVVGFRRAARHRLRGLLRHRLLSLRLPGLAALRPAPAVPAGAADRGRGHRAVRHPDRRADAAPARRLPGHRHAGLRRDHLSAAASTWTGPINITGGPSGIIDIDPPSFVRPRRRAATSSTTTCSWWCSCSSLVASRPAAATRASAGPGRRSARTSSRRGRWASTPRWPSCRRSRSVRPSPVSRGALLASWQRSVFPDNFLFTESINMLAMVIIGGMGSLPGRDPGRDVHRGAAGDVPRLAGSTGCWCSACMLMVLMIFRPARAAVGPSPAGGGTRGRRRREGGS